MVTSPVNTYTITPKGYTSGNYDISYLPGTLTVTQSKFDTPTPTWSTTPGTVTWSAISKMGNVEVAEYSVALYKSGTTAPVYTTTVTAPTVTYDLASAIRDKGAGSYTVKVKAIASTTNNKDKVNVDDSLEGITTTSLYAAKVEAKFATDTVTTAGKGDSILVNSSASYIMIAGETGVSLNATLKNATGYTVNSCISSATSLTVSKGTLSGTNYSNSLAVDSTLASTDLITVTLALTARPATVSASITSNPTSGSAMYGYSSAQAPVLKANAGIVTGDNITANDYNYTYKWYLKIGDGANNQQIGTTESWTFPVGQSADSNYKVSCEVTATRKDNGMKTSTTAEYTVIITKATFTSTVNLTGWVYGNTGNTPTVSNNPGNADVEYLYSIQNSDEATWTNQKPTVGGIYFVKAKIKESSNYSEYTTPAIAFTITGNNNDWIIEPAIANWTYGTTAKNPTGAAKYGNVQYTYSGSSTGPFTNDKPSNAGIWYMKAYVPETSDYGSLEKVVSFKIMNASQNAPNGLNSQNATVSGKNDGGISGNLNGMEYRKAGENTYTTVTPEMISTGKITGITDGPYYVRYAAKPNYNASPDTAVVVGCDLKLKLSVPTFSDVTEGYVQPQAQILPIKAEGTVDARITSIIVSNATEFELTGTDISITAGSTLSTYKIRPVAGLAIGTHTATITVNYNNGAVVTGTVSLTVKANTTDAKQNTEQSDNEEENTSTTNTKKDTVITKPIESDVIAEPKKTEEVKPETNSQENDITPPSDITEDIEETGNLGNIIVIVESPEEELKKLKVELPNKEQVIDACLSEEEKQAVNRGETIEIRLTIKRIEEKIPIKDQKLVENQVQELLKEIDGLTIGKYLDIKLDKRFNGGDWIGIPETAGDVEIIIEIPPELQFPNTRYYISRVHGEEAQLLHDLGKDEKTITISTRFFSTYALLYEAVDEQHHCYWHLAILLALLIYLGFLIIIRDKKRGKNRIWFLTLDV